MAGSVDIPDETPELDQSEILATRINNARSDLEIKNNLTNNLSEIVWQSTISSGSTILSSQGKELRSYVDRVMDDGKYDNCSVHNTTVKSSPYYSSYTTGNSTVKSSPYYSSYTTGNSTVKSSPYNSSVTGNSTYNSSHDVD